MTIRIRGEAAALRRARGAPTAQEARGLHDSIIELRAELGRNALRFGLALAAMRDSRGYAALGFVTFADYLASDEVAVARKTAYTFMGIARSFANVQHAAQLDYTKLDILRQLVKPNDDPEQVAAWVEQARDLPREDLRAAVREEVHRRKQLPRAAYVPAARLTVPPVRPGMVPGQRPPQPEILPPAGTITLRIQGRRYNPLLADIDNAMIALVAVTSRRHVDYLLREVAPEDVARAIVVEDAARDPDDEQGSFGEALERNHRTAQELFAWLQQVLDAYHQLTPCTGGTDG